MSIRIISLQIKLFQVKLLCGGVNQNLALRKLKHLRAHMPAPYQWGELDSDGTSAKKIAIDGQRLEQYNIHDD